MHARLIWPKRGQNTVILNRINVIWLEELDYIFFGIYSLIQVKAPKYGEKTLLLRKIGHI